LITFFARYFVQYSSFSAMALIRFIISSQFITKCRNNAGDLCISVELGFPSMESLFVSFVNRPYPLLISIFVSGLLGCVVLCCVVLCLLCCVLCIFSLLVHLNTCNLFWQFYFTKGT
jgi:hypothetical protein